MIDRQRPSRLASERAKALFLGDVSISKQLEREERDLRKAIKLSRMEAQRAKKTENEAKSIKSSPPSSSSSLLKSSSPQQSSPLPPNTKTTKTTKTTKSTATVTASNSQKRKMGKPKAMEIPAKITKGCCKTINQIKSSTQTEKRPKSGLIIRTRSQNNYVNNSANHADYPKSTCGVNNINGISSPMIPCALQLGNGNSIDGLNLTNSANCDKPRPKIMAQRKFASISYNGNTYLKPRDTDFSSMKELFTKHKPSAEDFLTFLCFRSTNLLPPHLDFYALNKITSKDSINMLNNDITSDKTANETVEPDSTIKSHNQSDQSNLSTSMKTNKGPTNGKVQMRKRASINCTRKTDANGKKDSKDKRKGKDNLVNSNFTVKNNASLTNSTEDLKKRKTGERKRGAGATRASNSGRKSSSDENRPKKSFDLTYSQLKRSPHTSSASRHKSQTKVIKATNDSQDNQFSIQPISNGKISKRSLSQSGVSDNNSSDVKKKVKTKVICDRILRSTRKSSSTSNTTVHHVEETCPSNERQKLITSENPVENLDIPVSIKSAINRSSVNSPKKKKRAVNNDDTTNNCRTSRSKESMTVTSIPTEPQQSKKNGQIKLLPSEAISNKGAIKFGSSARVGTRSCKKR